MLDIRPVKTRAHDHQNRDACEHIGLCHPFSASLIGGSGSGKSVLAVNLLTNDNLFGGYFDDIYLVGATVHSDDTWKALNVPKKNQFTDIKTMIPKVEALIRKQKKLVENKGVAASPKICIVWEDVTSNIKLLHSAAYLQSYVQNRHLNCSTFAMCHKLTAQNRTARMNSSHIFMFPSPKSEILQLVKDFLPHNLTKAEFVDLITYCWTPDKKTPKPFLWLNMKVDVETRVRKNLDQILQRNAPKREIAKRDGVRQRRSSSPLEAPRRLSRSRSKGRSGGRAGDFR